MITRPRLVLVIIMIIIYMIMIIFYDYPPTSGVGDVVVAQNHVVEGNRWRRDFFQFIVVLHEDKCLLLLLLLLCYCYCCYCYCYYCDPARRQVFVIVMVEIY